MKRLLIALLVHSRMLALWRFWHRKQITILMLHGVAGKSSDAAWAPLWERPTPEQLSAVMRQLCEDYTPISLRDAVDILDGSSPPIDYGLVVTFDDGYRNNFSEALPALEKLGVPATFFIATAFVESGIAYWVDRLDYALQQVPDERRLLRSHGHEFDLRGLDREAFTKAYRDLRVSLKRNLRDDGKMLEAVEELVRSLEAESTSTIDDVINSDPYVSVATWNKQRTASESGAIIGSHSVDHFRLTAIPQADVDKQLTESRNDIEKHIGTECEFFCYPNGSNNEFVRERVNSVGYRAAVTTEHGLNEIGRDLFSLRRYPLPRSASSSRNLLQLSGLLESRIAKKLLGKT